MNKIRAGFVARSLDYYLPPVNVSGPFGGGHTEWSKYRTVILIGAGIGITPFASILQAFMHRCTVERLQEKEKERRKKKKQATNGGALGLRAYGPSGAQAAGAPSHPSHPSFDKSNSGTSSLNKRNVAANRLSAGESSQLIPEKHSSASSSSSQPPLKLYFIWVGRSHTGYEWLIDIIREAESLDHSTGKLHLQVQLYITTPPQQFDLRTAISVSGTSGPRARLDRNIC